MNHIELDAERRRQRALERLASNHPACAQCEEADWRCLERHSIGDAADSSTQITCRNCQSKASCRCAKGQCHELNDRACLICGEDHLCCLEDHHISGRKHGDMTVFACRNCHRKLTDMQKDHPP
jgi:hypothetical protein